MKNSRQLLTNISIVLAGAIIGSGIFLLLSGERGWLKFIAWAIFFTAIFSPYLYAKDSDWRCSLFSRSKK